MKQRKLSYARVASNSSVCMFQPLLLQARVCNKTRSRRRKGKAVRPLDQVWIPTHRSTLLICHPHFLTLFYLCILIIQISDNLKSFFYPNDFEITGLDCIIPNAWQNLLTALNKRFILLTFSESQNYLNLGYSNSHIIWSKLLFSS